MPARLARIAIFATVVISAVSTLRADISSTVFGTTDGTRLELKAVPQFLQRVFVPVVAHSDNTFAIENAVIDQILETPKGYAIEKHKGGLTIKAPAGEAAGYARVRAGQRELTLTLVNLVPYSHMRNGFLDGYRIGDYLPKPLKGLLSYSVPKGFIRLTAANADLWISDHYRLRDFQCKLDGASKFLIVRPEALMKLELLQHTLAALHGLTFDRFTIMSGYRTPYYNSMIGNETGYSRHLYGDAMDIYIDRDHSGAMDDINRDGKVDSEDARFLMRVAESIDNSREWGWLKGGAGIYKANSAHGPYLHLDARGYVARWGV
jgi:hypothetical protein